MYRISDLVINVPLVDLVDNTANADYHGTLDVHGKDAWFVEDVAAHGVLMPLLLSPDGRTISDGHRRKAAAMHCGLESVPCVVLAAGDNAAFASAQLGRELSLYAKCRLYAERIRPLVDKGAAQVGLHNTVPDEAERAAAVEELDEAWVAVEEVLGVSRKSLRQGVKLLDKLNAFAASTDPREVATATKVTHVFRDRGLRPAQRLLGEEDDDACDPIEQAQHPDCSSWSAHDTSPIKRPAPKAQAQASPSPARAAKKRASTKKVDMSGLWRDDCLYLLSEVKAVLEDAGELTTQRDAAINALREAL